ncbi:heterokaryon incompatibility protein-domain-containing protein [Paraphoma chrysanthemicola]|uniref:Heterokaryon incompatibility protein-domain-containing protein n=1 Tax=Paraphoma chrysanthemicola TaxID=798071 RepID=A0A8K0RFF2_9PLEO|nr:heterokaryon incompatibility protein-domain-containing protein [Paraphoma chrysanthemicola]
MEPFQGSGLRYVESGKLTLFKRQIYEPSDPFVHAPLNHQQPSIRLIRVLPNLSKDGLIQCELRHTTIHHTYDCLSYVWGRKWDPKWILINNQPMQIRSNLFNFLASARSKRHILQRWLWIDALCINQENNAERVHQVQQMGDIYSNAISILSWLGTSDRTAAFLRNIASGWDSWNENDDTEHMKHWIHNGLEDFFACEYWDRAWITQEVGLAREIIFMADDAEAKRNDLTSWVLNRNLSLCHREAAIISGTSQQVKGRSLFYLLEKLQGKHCEIPRDRVFSLLRLSGDGDRIAVDYDSRPSILMRNIIRSCPLTFCLCSLRILQRCFPGGLANELSVNSDQPGMFAELTLPTVDSNDLSSWNAPCLGVTQTALDNGVILTTVWLDLSHICQECSAQIAFEVDSSIPDVAYCLMNKLGDLEEAQNWHETRGCIVQLSENKSLCTIKFSFALICEMTENLAIWDSPCCKRIGYYGTASEQSCKDCVLSLCLDEDSGTEGQKHLEHKGVRLAGRGSRLNREVQSYDSGALRPETGHESQVKRIVRLSPFANFPVTRCVNE